MTTGYSNGIGSLSTELPVVLNDLVPLSLVVERIIGQAHAELANLAEM